MWMFFINQSSILLKFLFKRATPIGIYQLKVNNRTRCEICSKLTIKKQIFFRLISGTSEDFVRVSQNLLRHQTEFVSSFIILWQPSTNYPLSIRNFSCLAVSGGFTFLWGVPQMYKRCISTRNTKGLKC